MTVSDQIIQVLDALCEKFGLMIDWTSENVIPYITTLMDKLIQWEIWSSVAWIAMCAIAIVVIIVVLTRPSVKELISDFDIECAFLIAFAIVFGGASVAAIICNIMDIIKCVTFPEMYVFEYVQGVINGGC